MDLELITFVLCHYNEWNKKMWLLPAQEMFTVPGEVAQWEKQDKYLACGPSAVVTQQF